MIYRLGMYAGYNYCLYFQISYIIYFTPRRNINFVLAIVQSVNIKAAYQETRLASALCEMKNVSSVV